MKINTVTITGADDSIKPKDLLDLSKKYPFVEWGILLSKKSMGCTRFPSEKWMNELRDSQVLKGVNLSGHLCGSWVRDITLGNGFTFMDDMPYIQSMFRRFQLNFHSIVHEVEIEEFLKALKRRQDVQYIFQLDDVNNTIVDLAKEHGIDCAALFDTSGGIGQLPKTWPAVKENLYCGYAGGLSPDNLLNQLEKISKVCGNDPIWIDVETNVRSMDDTKFDLLKVIDFLEISKPYIN
jgi:phosphoribosylanthranilate isomerase